MAEIIDLERFRHRVAADKGFRTWLSRFQEQFGPDTRLKDLSPRTLLYLASPGEENLYVVFDLIMGSRGLGGSVRFRLDEMETSTKLKIMDTALLVLDRIRYEVMRRLGWVEEVPDEDVPLIRLVALAWDQGAAFGKGRPRLSGQHPDYDLYSCLPEREQVMFLRRLIPRAVATFQALQERGEPT